MIDATSQPFNNLNKKRAVEQLQSTKTLFPDKREASTTDITNKMRSPRYFTYCDDITPK